MHRTFVMTRFRGWSGGGWWVGRNFFQCHQAFRHRKVTCVYLLIWGIPFNLLTWMTFMTKKATLSDASVSGQFFLRGPDGRGGWSQVVDVGHRTRNEVSRYRWLYAGDLDAPQHALVQPAHRFPVLIDIIYTIRVVLMLFVCLFLFVPHLPGEGC